VLLSIDIHRHVIIYSDSQSSLLAITAYRCESRARARMRMAGRPFLHLISRVCAEKQLHDTSVEFHWVAAHSAQQSLPHVGNRIADCIAKHYSRRGAILDSRVPRLPLEREEPFISMRSTDGTPVFTTGDPRRHCNHLLHQFNLDTWRHSNTQNTFSSSHSNVRAFWLSVVAFSPHAIGFALRLLANVLQWNEDWVERRCRTRGCNDVALDSIHFASCHNHRRERAGACTRICDLISLESDRLAAIARLQSHGDNLRPLLVATGFMVADSPQAEAGALFGVFGTAAAKRRLRELGAAPHRVDSLVDIIRSILLGWAFRAWRSHYCSFD